MFVANLPLAKLAKNLQTEAVHLSLEAPMAPHTPHISHSPRDGYYEATFNSQLHRFPMEANPDGSPIVHSIECGQRRQEGLPCGCREGSDLSKCPVALQLSSNTDGLHTKRAELHAAQADEIAAVDAMIAGSQWRSRQHLCNCGYELSKPPVLPTLAMVNAGFDREQEALVAAAQLVGNNRYSS